MKSLGVRARMRYGKARRATARFYGRRQTCCRTSDMAE
jgi:hypothetical protein